MAFFDHLFTRRRAVPRFSTLPQRTKRHLVVASQDLTRAEDEMARQLGISSPPRLLLVDEEEAVIILRTDRAKIS